MSEKPLGDLSPVHSFKNHLAIIIGFSDLLLTELPPDSPHRKDVLEINKAGHEALALLVTMFPKA